VDPNEGFLRQLREFEEKGLVLDHLKKSTSEEEEEQ
jgi:hypothetical protein